ncbi:MAG: ATP-dependent DNA helicase RecG [Chloroflexi bacterium]|nr:ATP-dependent DNA helicase RecG [Chloroflexota bacterium]
MTADLARLAAVLEGELRSGCRDTLVEGGLDELLRRQARDEPPRSPLLRMVAALPAAGYRSLGVEERRSWLRRARATIAQEQRGATNGAATRTRAPAASSEGAKPRRKPSQRRSPPAEPVPEGEAALEWPIARAGTRLGAKNLERLERLGLATVGDALRHYPHRYHDFSVTVPIAALRVGEEQTVRGTVDRARPVRMGRGGRMQVCEAMITDETGARLRVVWFNQPWLAQQLPAGTEIALSGTVKAYRGRPTIDNPAFEKLGGEQRETGRLVPVYPSTQGLAQRTLRTAIARIVDRFVERLPETLPEELRAKHDLPGIVEATRQMHYPDSKAELDAARRRIAFDELLAIQIGVVRRKREWQSLGDAPVFAGREAIEAFLATLPFELTRAQRDALDAMLEDLARPQPMARLLQGDVGSGKTVVALAAMIGAVAAGHQAVLMAPTEVLAEQHFRTICGVLSGEPEPPLNGVVSLPFLPLPLRVVLLTGSTRAKERRDALEAIRHGGANLIVGTHALIQQGVEFQRLGLAVVDEQHRFGVMQRSALRQPERTGDGGVEAASSAHLLVMTATPIPRSLALTIYGDLDLTVIDELPPGRTPIETRWLPPHDRGEAFAALRAEVEAGRQGFVICPLVEGSDAVVSRAATEEYERLCREQFPDLADRIALLHGRMSGRDKDAVMQRFARGEASILVSTAVVEVGIDVPNATVMLIEGADRFGLSQLHQFRGRVGRGEHASTCYLLADDPTPEAQERLSLVARNRDGFALAQADLELRGPGELFGTRQAGTPSLRVASLLDARLINTTRGEAEALIEADPELAAEPHAALRALVERAEAGLVAEAH